ncbi:MAG: hypothetical protein E6K54_05095 [Gammaproteobacteria bacterium]|nr:MAG: hypothetical protein E6K54_05095 [Gammaproteobacteria bacterium]
MPTITNIQNRTHKILDRFTKDIASIKVNNDFERIHLYRETKKLFNTLEKLDIEEFAKIFIVYNFTSMDIQENEKHQEVLNYLITLIIQKYSETDLLRYFLPDYLSQKETRPESSHSSSRINYWFQLIGYWLRQLLNKPIYALKTEYNEFADPIKYIKASLTTNTPYLVNTVDNTFKNHLAILREKIQENSIFPKRSKISRVNSSTDQAYHQQLLAQEKELESMVKTFKEKEQEFVKREDILIRLDEEIEARKELVAQNEHKNEEISKLFHEERAAVKEELGSLRQQQELIVKERAAFKTENEMLQEKISVLESQLLEKEANIETFIEKEQAFEERLSIITATVEKKLQGNAVLIQQQEKLLEKEQLLQERVNALTTSEKNFLERRELLIQNRQEMEKQKKDLEKEIEALKETISKLKESKSTEKIYIRKIEDENFELLKGIQELVNDVDVISLASSGVSSGSTGSDQSLQASSSAFFKPAANNPDLQNETITLVK